ncbi:MAG: hypothetical protein HY900_28075, partial [Deltaproteobacteria bacterium]|nr:hypothetical protein [Deltaproteobacteria bacterium]
RELHFFRELVKEMAYERIFGALGGNGVLASLLEDLKARKIDPYSAAEKLVGGLSCHL